MKSETRTFSQKWGDSPFSRHHTQVSNLLIRYQVRLGLSASECWLITVISQFKHDLRNPYPSQDLIGSLIGKKRDTVQKTLADIEEKGLVNRISEQFQNTAYDFRHLVAAVNECYYEDYPTERPPLSLAVAQSGFASGEECLYLSGLRKWDSVRIKIRTDKSPYGKKSVPTKSRTKRDIGIASKDLDESGEEDVYLDLEKDAVNTPETLNVGDLFTTASVEDVIKLTADVKSERRLRQLFRIADDAHRRDLWDKAYVATREGMEKTMVPKPGAYFSAILKKSLEEAKVDVPATADMVAEVKAFRESMDYQERFGMRDRLGLGEEE